MSEPPPPPGRFQKGWVSGGRPADGWRLEGDFPKSERTGTPDVVRTRRWVWLAALAVVAVGALIWLMFVMG